MFETALKNLIAVGKIAKSVPSCSVIVSAGMSGSADKIQIGKVGTRIWDLGPAAKLADQK